MNIALQDESESSHFSSPAVGLFITLARQSGTRWHQMNLEILTVFMALNDSAVSTVTRALEVF